MKYLLPVLVACVFLLTSCKTDQKADTTLEKKTESQMQELSVEEQDTSIANVEIVEVQTETQVDGETEAKKIIDALKSKSKLKDKNCQDVQKIIDAIIADYKKDSDSDAIFDRIDALVADGMYIDCRGKKEVSDIDEELLKADASL